MTQEPDYKALWEAELERTNQLEEQLSEAKHKIHSLFEEAGDSIFLVDFIDYTIIDANNHAARRLGYAHDELTNMSLDDIEVDIETDNDIKPIWTSDFSGTQVYECYHQHKDGRLIPIEISSRVIKFNQREVILMFARNVELRKQLQEHNIQLTLERERVTLLTNFIQNAGHEFRTPLSKIATTTYLMNRLDDEQKRKENAKLIEQQVERITDLVNRLLLMVKLESEGQSDQQHLQTYSVLQLLVEHYRQQYPDGPTLSAEIPNHLPLILGNAKYLHIALSQLLDNAYHFTSNKGQIHIQTDYNSEFLVIKITDTGYGMDEDDLKQVFKTFWRKDIAHSTPGFGLGLPIAQRIIQQHEGIIQIQSSKDNGTTVRVTLPIQT